MKRRQTYFLLTNWLFHFKKIQNPSTLKYLVLHNCFLLSLTFFLIKLKLTFLRCFQPNTDQLNMFAFFVPKCAHLSYELKCRLSVWMWITVFTECIVGLHCLVNRFQLLWNLVLFHWFCQMLLCITRQPHFTCICILWNLTYTRSFSQHQLVVVATMSIFLCM